jgi:hypothetical protein
LLRYVSLWISVLSLILLKLLNFKTQVTHVTAHYAVTMAAVLALGRSVVESVSVMRVMDAVTITVSSLPIPVATAAVTVQRAIFCSPTGGGTGPATSTVKPESTPSSVNHPTTVVPASSSVYYYTYE